MTLYEEVLLADSNTKVVNDWLDETKSFLVNYGDYENEVEVDVELGSEEDITPGELVYDAGNDDAGNLFDFDDDL